MLASLGLKAEDFAMGGHVLGTRIACDTNGLTTVPGVWVAGNITDPTAQVSNVAADAGRAGHAINLDLLDEDVAVGLALHRGGREFWDQRYSTQDAIWSGRPNAQLVAEAAELPPGRALDVGAGEGADSVWLAGRGWQVTGVDISETALARAAHHARDARVHDRTTWVQADLSEWAPEPQQYDLVAAHFMHLPTQLRTEVFGSLAAAVAPGGTLLLVGHDPSDLAKRMPGHRMRHMFFTADEVATTLDPADWEIVAAESRPRQMPGPGGRQMDVADVVLHARRRTPPAG